MPRLGRLQPRLRPPLVALHVPAFRRRRHLAERGSDRRIGPQNLHVLRTGLAGRHVAAAVLLCVAADALHARPALLAAIQLACAPLLLWLAAAAGREALARPTSPLRRHAQVAPKL
jgi:hypothetical protein